MPIAELEKRKYAKPHMAYDIEPGAYLPEAIRGALIMSLRNKVPVKFEFNGTTIWVDSEDMIGYYDQQYMGKRGDSETD